jgi:hypothetical protein
MLDCKLNFLRHVDYLHSEALKLLGLTRCIIYHICSLGSLKVLYVTLIRSKLEYASVFRDKLTVADSNKLENIQRKFTNLCYNIYSAQLVL